MNNPVCDSNIILMNNILTEIYLLAEVLNNQAMDIETVKITEAEIFAKYQELESFKPRIKKDFEDYFQFCKENNIPIFLNYYRIYKEL